MFKKFFIKVTRKDDMRLYCAALSMKLSEIQRERLKEQAKKVLKKVKKLSVALLVCFMLIYATVIIFQHCRE